MSDVFVSYKREDEARVVRLVQALEKHGFSVWWDRNGLRASESWQESIEHELARAKCVVVVWTTLSTAPEGRYVRDEARHAEKRRRLVPVMLDKVDPPLGFGELQAIDLTHWRSSPRDPDLLDLVGTVKARIEGRPAPALKGPMKRVLRRLTAGSLLSGLLMAGAAFATNTLNVQNHVCALGLAQPGLADACGALGLGGQPAKAERLAWTKRKAGDCAAVSEHLRQFPGGAYQAVANNLLAAKTITSQQNWVPSVRPQRFFVPAGKPSPDEAQARTAAHEEARKVALRHCQALLSIREFRRVTADVVPEDWRCDHDAEGWRCSVGGGVSCQAESVETVTSESCGEVDVR